MFASICMTKLFSGYACINHFQKYNSYMSIEADLNAFRDLALEEQTKITSYLDKYGHFTNVYHNLDPILNEIVGDNNVVVTGEVYFPETNSRGQYQDYNRLPPRGMLSGKNFGVRVGSRGDIEPLLRTENEQLIIGYWVGLFAVNTTTALEQGRSEFYAFAPVENSQLHVPELIVPETGILPDSDDRIAVYIDEAVLNDPKDFNQLISIFDRLSNRSELEIDYYLNYLNFILPLYEYSAKITSTSFIHADEDTFVDIIEPGSSFFSEQLLPSIFEYVEDIGLLCISVDTISINEQRKRYYIPLNSITKLSLTRHD
jgi:hypothetical protein